MYGLVNCKKKTTKYYKIINYGSVGKIKSYKNLSIERCIDTLMFIAHVKKNNFSVHYKI